MLRITTQGKTVSIFPCEKPNAPVLYLNTFSGEGAQVFAELHKTGHTGFSLVAISDLDWNRDMVPWDAPPAFQNGEPCIGGAGAYLRLLVGTILPAAEKELVGIPCWRGLAGYSLAGLFAIYALYQTEVFSRFASISGSLWFPGFRDYILSHEITNLPDCLYFSVGDKESKTRNPVLQTVRANTEALYTYYRSKGIPSLFQVNRGNHFQHAVERTAAGIAWLADQ